MASAYNPWFAQPTGHWSSLAGGTTEPAIACKNVTVRLPYRSFPASAFKMPRRATTPARFATERRSWPIIPAKAFFSKSVNSGARSGEIREREFADHVLRVSPI
jgi:hypothetical protein